MIFRKDNILPYTTGVVVLLAAIPLLYVVHASLQLSPADWRGLWSSRLPLLLWNTLSLVVLVALGSLLLGVSAAWLIARRSFAGRRLALWLMVLPLTIPTYVFAYIYTSLLESQGWLGRLWQMLAGGAVSPPDLYNVFGAALVLALSGFSYVFLMSYAAMARSNPHLEEAARLQGASSREVFRRVTLPLIRPAVAAGLAVVTLHVLSDFGAVSMLRYQTFTLS
ncbi:MAG: ABC transporter permease, partial [Gammaproteobacteria bacterium]